MKELFKSDSVGKFSKHFQITPRKLNYEALRFIKAIVCEIDENSVEKILFQKDEELERQSLDKYKEIIEKFIEKFPTSIEEDEVKLKESKSK